MTLLTDLFWSKVVKDDADCWLWTGALNSRGYGQWAVSGRSTSCHRLTYEAFVGPIPEDRQIDHLCRVKRCCNPAHLEVVTAAENVRRSREHITACPQGHPYTPDNTILKNGRQRSCRECQKARQRAWRQRQHLALAGDPR